MRFKKHLPTREKLKEMPSLQFLGHLIFEPNLWHFNRHSLSFAVLVGLFCCFLPIPFQMFPALIICVWVKCNVPVTVAIVWVSNPITMPPMMYFSYRVGCWMMGIEPHFSSFDADLAGLTEQLVLVVQPLLVGSLTCGAVSGVIGFLLVRGYYRWRIARYKQKKLRQRQAGSAATRT